MSEGRILVNLVEGVFVVLELARQELQSRFECIEGVAQSEELIQIYWERHLH